jgi:hypothetical protein
MNPQPEPAVTPGTDPPPHQGPSRPRARWAAFFAALVVIGAVLPSLPAGVRNWDNLVKLQLARSVVAGRGLVLTEPTPDDGQFVVEGRGGRRVTYFPPGAALLHVATLAMERPLGGLREGVPALGLLAALAAVLAAWGRRAGATATAALAGALLACLGTSLWPTAAHGHDVLIEALALAMLFWAAAGEDELADWLGAGALLGFAVATRLGAATLAAPALVLVITRHPREPRRAARRGLALAVGALPGLALLLWTGALSFDAPLDLYRPKEMAGRLALYLPWFSREHLEGMLGLTVSPGKGLFWYSPPLLAVAAAARPLWRRHRLAAFAFLVHAVATVLAFGRFVHWHGDWAWGPRFVASFAVAVAPLVWWAWERLATAPRWARAVAATAALVLVAAQAFPTIGHPVYWHWRFVLIPLEQAGALVTRPALRSPLPADNLLLYFRADTSPFGSLWTGFTRAFADPRSAPSLWLALARAAVAPLLAALATWAVWRRTRGATAPR